MAGLQPVQVLAVTGGKGGVGKTNAAINLSICLAEMGRRVVLMDADLGLANVDILLGVSPRETLEHVIKGQCSLRDVLLEGPRGVRIVPAASGTQHMADLSMQEQAGLIHAFSDLGDDIDTLVIDTAAGISHHVISFARAAQEVLVVVANEPTSLTDAYALIKVLNQNYGVSRFYILANMVRSLQEGNEVFDKLSNAADRFLDVALVYLGAVPFDDYLRKAVQRQKAVCDIYPRTKSALAYRALAQKIRSWSLPASPRGHLEFFMDRLVQGAR